MDGLYQEVAMSRFRRLCPLCKTFNHYARWEAGEVSRDNGATWEAVTLYKCKDCGNQYLEEEMLIEKFKTASFVDKDGKKHFIGLTKEYKQKRWPSKNKQDRKLLEKLRKSNGKK